MKIADASPRLVRVGWLAALFAMIGLGWFLGSNVAVTLPDSVITLLIVVGLYAATTNIEPREALKDWKLIASAVTIGVVLKAALVGLLSFPLTHSVGASLIIGVVFSQIDPLSVGAMKSSSSMAKRAKHIIHSWAAFDDPISVLLARYVVPIGLAAFEGIRVVDMSVSLSAWVVQLALNLLVAAATYGVWRAGQRFTRHPALEFLLLVVALAVAVMGGFVLAIAITGLFLRPLRETVTDRIVQVAYCVAAVCIGTLLPAGINVRAGLLVGACAYGAHFVVSEVLTRLQRLEWEDRVRLGLGQQSGITACNLVLMFASVIPNLAAICVPALVTVNVLHLLANMLFDYRQAHRAVK